LADVAVVLATLEPPPSRLGITHWSSRLLAAELGLSNVKVARVWREHGLKLWRAGTFKFSTGPELEAKLRDVVGLYLNPPDKAVVLCVDESGTAPPRCSLPWRWPPARSPTPATPGTGTRNSCGSSARSRKPIPHFAAYRGGQLRHGQAPGRDGLAGQEPQDHAALHPDFRSWLNMEIFFGIITRQAIRRGSFTSVKDLITAIQAFIDG
jgi:hypothetical protein